MKEQDLDSPARDSAAVIDRWVERADEGSPEARAGALLRQAVRRDPPEADRLAAIARRLRAERRRPHRHWALRLAIALALLFSGGALTAAAQRYLHILTPAGPAPARPAPDAPRAPHRRAALGSPAPSPAPQTESAEPPAEAAVAPADIAGTRAEAVGPRTGTVAPQTAARVASPAGDAAPQTIARAPRSAAADGDGARAASATASVAPADVTPPPLAVERNTSVLAQESALLADALRKLRQRDDPGAALVLLDGYESRFGAGALAPEAALARIEALIKLRRNADALSLLERMAPAPRGTGRELLITRAELRAAAGRCAAAQPDFDLLLAGHPAFDAVTERALWGRASCRAGADAKGARLDLQDYLARFPDGRFAADARAALGQ